MIIEVLQVVHPTLSLLVIKEMILDLAHDLFIFCVALPEQIVVVDVVKEWRRLKFYLFKVVFIVSIAGVF